MKELLIEVLISPEDDDLAKYKWCIHRGYAARNIRDTSANSQVLISLHRTILERKLGRKLEPHEQTDHINRDKLDDRRENLRLATRSENSRNRVLQNNNTSGLRGVTKHRKRWVAQISIDGKTVNLGTFDTKQEASEVYLQKYHEMHHEYPPEIICENLPLH
jgi:hypothetical protein